MQSGKKIDQKIELLLPSQFSSFDFLQQHKIITSTMHKESNNQPLLTFHKLHEDDSISAFEISTQEWNYVEIILHPRKFQRQNFIRTIPRLQLNC